MNQEKQFTNILQMLIDEAYANDNILTEERVRDAYALADLSEEQFAMIIDYLKKKHIGIDEPLKDEDYLEQEEIDYLKVYMEELELLPKYSDGEKQAYTLSAMAGDVEAQSKLIEAFLPDVAQIAKLYTGQGVLLEDLIGEGNVALTMGVSVLGAYENATEAQGGLTKLIMDGMEEYIAECVENTKQDEKILDKVNKVAEKANELSEELRRKVTVDELIQETGMSRKMIMDALKFSGNAIDTIETQDGNA